MLWNHAPATVRQIHERLPGSGYTTVLKLLQIMTEKGYVHRDESDRAHIYRPAITQEATQTRLLGDLLDRAFSGSATQLVLRALSTQKATPTEIEEIRKMLDNIEQQQGDKS